jgi:hypothetical protein
MRGAAWESSFLLMAKRNEYRFIVIAEKVV